MKVTKKLMGILLVTTLLGAQVSALPSNGYLSEEDYHTENAGTIYEDRGIVLENNPALGYMVYRNSRGRSVTAYYYSAEMVVEKAPYYEQEDKIGYIDELFPSFKFDVRDTTIAHIGAGDNIYLQMDKEGYITYISAFNDYAVRYGKVHTWVMGAEAYSTLVLEDTKGKLYSYSIPTNVPISKGGAAYSLGRLKEGEWVRLLVSQKILGQGVIEESIKEIVVDPDTRVISKVYRGDLIEANSYRNTVTIKDSQSLAKTGWTPYEPMKTLSVNPREAKSYYLGQPVSFDYIARHLRQKGNYVYVAAENYMGKEQAVKMNFQQSKQATLPPTRVIYAAPGVIRLLSGEHIMLAEDSIIVRDQRLVGPAAVMVGDVIQPVITGENKLAVGRILDDTTTGMLEVVRGRVKYIEASQSFEVETFSLLEEAEWYFHPSPRNFSIGPDTKLYGPEGISVNGLEDFLTYGEFSKESEVYTVITSGDKAVMIIDMPYTKEAVRGYVYGTETGVKLRDVYTYDRKKDKWESAKGNEKNIQIENQPNTVVIKEGKVVPWSALEKGDQLVVMLENPVSDYNIEGDAGDGGDAGNEAQLVTVPSYIVLVQ